jgi:glycosyltransferase involved in cell wall biosynthesis
MNKFFVSVVIPLYNKQSTILRALNSVFAQTFQPLEIVVVNDGSTDGSEKVVEELNHPLVRLIHQPNAGVSAARNKGIAEAKGEWIAFLDADDEWLPSFTKTIKWLHDKYPLAGVLGTGYFVQDRKGVIKANLLRKTEFDADDGLLKNYFEIASQSDPPLWTSAICIRKKLIIDIRGFKNGLRNGEDLLLWAQLALITEIAYSINPQSIYHFSSIDFNINPRIPDEPDVVGKTLLSLWKGKKSIPGLKSYISFWFKIRAHIFLKIEGRRKQSIQNAVLSLKYNFFSPKVYILILLVFLPTKIRLRLFNYLKK